MMEYPWLDELYRRAREDPWRDEMLQDVERSEADFEAIRQSLSQNQQEQLDRYIAACEDLEHSLVFIAYRLGWEHGKIGAVQEYGP